MKRIATILILLTCLLSSSIKAQNASVSDSHRLGKALDYFAGGKFHEALLLLVPLDKKHNLNPRFKAYIGVCYYHEWEYVEACRYLDSVMPKIEVFAPHERSIYYNAAAESHFNLGEYEKAIPLYEKQILVCYDNEKGDAFYRLGFCYMFKNQWASAVEYFHNALLHYTQFGTPEKDARKEQLDRMIKGCEENAKEK